MRLDLWRKRLWHLRHGGLVQLRDFEQRRSSMPRAVGRRKKQKKGVLFDEWPAPDPETWKGRRPLVVGVIADTFTLDAFAYEWNQVELDPRRWSEQLRDTPIDLLFVESAWHGNHDQWKGRFTGGNAPSQYLSALIEHCRAHSIPTVFWNKEDPVHYNDFLATARLFDWVFTTDVSSVDSYRRDFGHNRIGVMPFGAQPAIHNPIRPVGLAEEDERSVAFAGTYFKDKYPERREQMEMLLGGALDVESRLSHPLDIFSRFQDMSDAYRFPAPYDAYVRGELTYSQMLTANRSYHAILNVNSVVASPSMCARRIFEATACGTPVISAPSAAIDSFFDAGDVIQVKDRTETGQWIRALDASPELRDRITHRAQRRIWREHAYSHRLDAVFTAIGHPEWVAPPRTVTTLVSTNRPHQLDHVLTQMADQCDVDLQVLILTHGFDADPRAVARARDMGLNVQWLMGERSWSLGECYNALVARADGDVLAKIDDDDWYGGHYLADQLAALSYSNAEVVGKHAHYMYLEGMDALCLRFARSERTWTHFVAGPTIVAPRDVFMNAPFEARTTGEDSEFLREVQRNGGRVFSSDRFGFIQHRSTHPSHTWQIDDPQVLATSRVVSFGKAFDHVLF